METQDIVSGLLRDLYKDLDNYVQGLAQMDREKAALMSAQVEQLFFNLFDKELNTYSHMPTVM